MTRLVDGGQDTLHGIGVYSSLYLSLLTSGLYGQQLEDSDSGRSEPLLLVGVRLWAFFLAQRKVFYERGVGFYLIAASSWFVPLSKQDS